MTQNKLSGLVLKIDRLVDDIDTETAQATHGAVGLGFHVRSSSGNTRLPMRLLAYHDGLPGDALTSQPQDLTWSRRLPHATVVATTRYV